MKKLYLILTAITVLALAAMSCGIQFVGSNPTPAPQGPIPQNGNPIPQGPENMNPGNQGPNPNRGMPSGNPGQGEIQLFTADQMTLNQGQCTNLHWQTQGGFQANLNSQQVTTVGQQQVCPPQTTVYTLGLDIGSQMLTQQITITVSADNSVPVQVATTPANNNSGGNKPPKNGTKGQLDFQAKDMYLDKGNYVHIGVKNNSTQSGDLYFAVSCTANFHFLKNDSATKASYSSKSVTASFNPNQERWTNSKILLDRGSGYYDLTCTISSPFDPDTSNNTVKKTLQVPFK
jgi:hypothetical protein